jgi:hypothetical protein
MTLEKTGVGIHCHAWIFIFMERTMNLPLTIVQNLGVLKILRPKTFKRLVMQAQCFLVINH